MHILLLVYVGSMWGVTKDSVAVNVAIIASFLPCKKISHMVALQRYSLAKTQEVVVGARVCFIKCSTTVKSW